MRKLFSANLSLVWISKPFWLGVVAMLCAEGLFGLLMLRYGSAPMDIIVFISLQCIGILAAVFTSLFLGTDYGDGTIRNKIIAGHKSSSIYIASLFTVIVVIQIIFLSDILTGVISGTLFFHSP